MGNLVLMGCVQQGERIMTYERDCEAGRKAVAALLRNIDGDMDRLPEIVRTIREAAADETGRGVGALYALARAAAAADGKSVVSGKSVSVGVAPGGRRVTKKKKSVRIDTDT